MATQRRKIQGLRRYPALIFLLGAGILAVLLPTALTVPQSGPTTLAEFAPVPGQGQGRSEIADLGQAASGGLGFGSGSGGPGSFSEPPLLGKPSQTKARLKRCVGSPPRQSEDPLSPPCVAFFEGDNGGATAKGVTRDEVPVMARLNNTSDALDERIGEVVDCAGAHAENDMFQDTVCKSYMKYFNDRYQTFNRIVHLYSYHNKVLLSDLNDRYRPFAHVGASSAGTQYKWLSAAFTGAKRASYVKEAPYQISFRADDEDRTAQVSSFVCQKLIGGTAKYAGDPTTKTRTRKFGFLFSDPPRKDVLRAGIKARCGLDITDESGDHDRPTGLFTLQRANVTTVILVVGNSSHAIATNNATGLGYFPEWFIPGHSDLNGIDVNFHGRTANSAQWTSAFGVTFDYRRDALANQPWYRAYREGCAECTEPTFAEQGVLFATAAYDAFNMLFYGIQAAGPRLTPENVDKGLHAIPARPSDDPYRPAAYFAPGNYSFMKDAMAIWWDPAGTPPGGANPGCYRLPRQGLRARAGEWPAGDGDVQQPGPCQGDTFS